MNKKIYILWYQGFNNAPMIVKKCLKSWIQHNPDWEIVQVDQSNLSNYMIIDHYIDKANKEIDLTHLSDIIRLVLLDKYGGVWVDSTVFCQKPLNDWINDYNTNGFFAFDKPGADRMLSTWFLYSEPNNYITKTWLNRIVTYWKINKKINNYFTHHHLFKELYTTDQQFKKQWDKVKKFTANIPHFVQNKNLISNLTIDVKNHIDDKKSPLYKLSYKYDQGKYTPNTNLAYLLNHDQNLKLIHIGKCAGTYVSKKLNIAEVHMTKPTYDMKHKYIIWIRNPIDRFVSAFNFAFAVINTDTSKLNINNLTLDNCLAPARIKHKMTHSFTYSKEYDDLVLHFKTANDLAEALTNPNIDIKNKAIRLMNCDEEHIKKGIGWYLDNGEFIKKYNKNILFVGSMENMDQDFDKLLILLDKTITNKDKIRENKNQDKHLSPLAITNIINFYKETDYKALQELFNHGQISKELLESYYKYSN